MMKPMQWLLASAFMILLVGGLVIMGRQDKQEERSASDTLASPAARQVRADIPDQGWSHLLQETLPLEFRVETARRIDERISSVDREFLLEILTHQPVSGDEENWWVVMNEIMGQMCKHGVGADQLTSVLSAVLADPKVPIVTRDYAAQHLAGWLYPVQEGRQHSESDPDRRRDALGLFARIVMDESLYHTTIPGTTIMMLTDLSERLPDQELAEVWDQVNPALYQIINQVVPSDLSLRVSAIQSVARRQSLEYHDLIRSLASSEESQPSMRLSSIAALGSFANPADRELLEEIAASQTKFQYAAREALKNF